MSEILSNSQHPSGDEKSLVLYSALSVPYLTCCRESVNGSRYHTDRRGDTECVYPLGWLGSRSRSGAGWGGRFPHSKIIRKPRVKTPAFQEKPRPGRTVHGFHKYLTDLGAEALSDCCAVLRTSGRAQPSMLREMGRVGQCREELVYL